MFPSHFAGIYLDVFGLFALAAAVFGNPGIGPQTGISRGIHNTDYLPKYEAYIKNERNSPSFEAYPAGQRTRRVPGHSYFGGYPWQEYEPNEPIDEITASFEINPSKRQYIEPPVQSSHPGPELIDFSQRFTSYYGHFDQQHGDGSESLDPLRVYEIDEEEYIPKEDHQEQERVEGGDKSEEGLSKLVLSEEDSESTKDKESSDRPEEESPRPENVYLIEQQLQDLINQISSLYTLIHRNPYLAPVITPYLHTTLPVSAPPYPPIQFPVPLGGRMIHFPRGSQPVNYPTRPVNYPEWSGNYPVSPINSPVRLVSYPLSPVEYRVPSVTYPVDLSPVNYEVRPVSQGVGPWINYPLRPVKYRAEHVNMPRQQTIPLHLRFH